MQVLFSDVNKLETLWLSDNPQYVTKSRDINKPISFLMHNASAKGKFNIVKKLIDKGFNPNKKDKSLLTPLHYSVKNKEYKITELLLRNEANVNVRGGISISGKKYEQLPIHIAAKKGDLKSLKLLLKYGSKINLKDHNGSTPLYYSVSTGNIELIGYLLNKGADPKISSVDEIIPTPLFKAVAKGNKKIIKLLVKNGADLSKKNKKKQTPLDYAESSNLRNVADYLRSMIAETKEEQKESFFRKLYQLVKKDPFF